jgi:hypothetical protein
MPMTCNRVPGLWNPLLRAALVFGFATARRSIAALAIVALVATVAHAQETRNAIGSLDHETRGELSLQLLAETKTKDHVLPKWCGDKVVFADYRTVFGISASAGARAETLVEIQDAISPRSFDCSRDGRTILFLNANKDRLFIFEDSQLSEYAISSPRVISSLGFRYGSLLSPDGNTIAMPATVVRLNRGPDVLKSKRILKTPDTDVFWTSHDVIFHRGGDRFAVASLSDLKTKRFMAKPRGSLVDGIHECGGGHYVLYYSDDHDNYHLVSLNPQTFALGASLMPGAEVGGIDSNGDACLLTKSNNVSVTQLIFLRGKNRRSIDLSPDFDRHFVLSKGGQAIATHKADRIGVDGGRVLIYRVTAADSR